MVGTLIGMVQMFANMTDPSKLGPYMAVALLATFYGAARRQPVLPADRGQAAVKLLDEEINRTLIIDGVLMIRESRARRWCAKCCWPICRRSIAMTRGERRAGVAAGGSRHHGEEKRQGTRRRRSRLVRHLRRPDGPAGRLLRDAGRVLDPGSGQAADRRGLDARSLRRAAEVRYSGIIEIDGLPTRPKLKNVAHINPEEAPSTPSPDDLEHSNKHYGLRLKKDTPSPWRPLRCARRCRTCRRSPRSRRTS